MKKAGSIRLLTVRDRNGTNLRTSYPQLSGKGCQYREEDPESKTISQDKYNIGEKVKKIEKKSVLPACKLNVHRKANYNYLMVSRIGMKENNYFLLSFSLSLNKVTPIH